MKNLLARLGKVGVLIAILAVLILFSPQIAHFATDFLWFDEVGYQSVFLTFTFAKFAVGFVVFLLVFLLSYVTLHFTTKYEPKVQVEDDTVVNVPEKKGGKRILALVPSLVLGLMAGYLSATALWQDILLFINQTKAGVTDPVFGRDISFYFFNLSLFETVYALAFLFLAVIFLFNLLMTIYLQGFSKHSFKLMGKRIIYFAVAFVLLLIGGFQLEAANLLYAQDGAVFGAGYTDLHITLPMYHIASLACVLTAICLLVALKKKNAKIAAIGPVVLAVVLLVGGLAATGVQNFIVQPAEIAKEQPYITNNIQMTNKAYGLEHIKEVEFSGSGTLTATDLQEEMDTIKNIRLIDYRPTSTVYNQLQSMRLYYKFVDVDIDRYDINGSQQQVYLSARELDQSSLDSSAQTWVNKYLKYTHGYGAVVSPVNQVTSQGQPEMWVENIPPNSEVPELEISRPEIYYGQLTNDYVIVNTKEPEFDYPIGDSNAQSQYEGDAGIPMNFMNKSLFAMDRANYKILFSNLITSDSKILLNRNILERAEKIAPFLTFDSNPYLVIHDGGLVWVIDAYTSTDKYPYAAKVTNRESIFYGENYIRNSVKVTVNAYNGETNFYIADDTDPLVQSYAKVFPGLFKQLDEMPENLQEHLKYSPTLFEVQTQIYQQYHMKNPTVFYNKEDVWSIANEIYGSETQQMEPYYVNMRLPGSNELEYLLMRPFTPTQKQNMVAWLAARNDDEHYGELVLFKFPKQSTVYGPMQVEARISNDSEISQNLNLWDQQGSSVIRSNLLVIPIKESLLYIEPIYLTMNNENSLPEVVRIVVSYKDQIVMEKTLDDALSKLFGTDFRTEGVTESTPDEGNDTPSSSTVMGYDEVVEQIKAAYQNAKTSAQNGNWADYGHYLEQLEKAISQLDKAGASSEDSAESADTENPTATEEPSSEDSEMAV
ncbi:MAG: UPF0182 family protein [Peptococcaceae bacterium]|nr:UPF0182 family protein [Peptococcaceae bacterium]